MVRLVAEFKRAFLSALYLPAKSQAVPLGDALNAFLLSSFDSVKTGRLVVSHSGAGKSTLIHLLAGTDLPDTGEVNWSNQFVINHLSRAQKAQFWNQKMGPAGSIFCATYLSNPEMIPQNEPTISGSSAM